MRMNVQEKLRGLMVRTTRSEENGRENSTQKTNCAQVNVDGEIESRRKNLTRETNVEETKSIGLRFPWCAIIFMLVGMASEVVDAIFMNATLESLGADLSSFQAILISAVVGMGCFASMAFVGFQQANRKYYTRLGEQAAYIFWASAGAALVVAKILAGLVDGGLGEVLAGREGLGTVFATEEFISNLVIAIVQLVLYLGTGLMTRDSVRILTDQDMREYFLVRRQYDKLMDELAGYYGDLIEDVNRLQAYQKYAERLVESKEFAKINIEQYKRASRALVEAKMSMVVDPSLMDEIYHDAATKEKRLAGIE